MLTSVSASRKTTHPKQAKETSEFCAVALLVAITASIRCGPLLRYWPKTGIYPAGKFIQRTSRAAAICVRDLPRELFLLPRNAAEHELHARSRYGRGGPLFRGVRFHDASQLPHGGAQRAHDARMPSCDVQQLFSTFGISRCDPGEILTLERG